MDPTTPPTCHDRAVALLREVDTDLAVTVDAVKPSEDGEVLVGLLGWLPFPQRIRLCRAILLAHPPDSTCDFEPEDPYITAKAIAYDSAAWNQPFSVEHRSRRDAAVKVWVLLGHSVPAMDDLDDGEESQAEQAQGVPPVADVPGGDDEAGQSDELQQGEGERSS